MLLRPQGETHKGEEMKRDKHEAWLRIQIKRIRRHLKAQAPPEICRFADWMETRRFHDGTIEGLEAALGHYLQTRKPKGKRKAKK